MRKINLFNVTMRTCCMLIISVLLISGCASSPRLISPKQLGPQKVLLVKAGDAAGEESLKLSEMFQEVSRLNVVLNPNKYISAYNLDGYAISEETLHDLYKEEIAIVIMIQDITLNHAYIVSDAPSVYKLETKYDEIDVFDNNGYLQTYRGDKPYGGTKSVRYWWHYIMAEAASSFVVYDTESASQIHSGSFPEKSKLSGFSFSDQGGSIQTPRAYRGLAVFANSDWDGRFLSQKQNENNPAIKDGMLKADDKAVKRLLTYVAKLKKKS